MYGTRHTRDYGESVPDIWRQSIAQLKAHEIQRGLRRLTSGGSASPPSLPQFMKACREIGDSEGPANPGQLQIARPEVHYIDAHANKCIFAYLNTHEATSQDSLAKMLAEKNRIVADFKNIATTDTITGKEIKVALFKAFDRVCEPMPKDELDRHRHSFTTTGYAIQ